MAKLDSYSPRRGDTLIFMPATGRMAAYEVVDDTGRLVAPAFKDGERYAAHDGWFPSDYIKGLLASADGGLYLAGAHGLERIYGVAE